MPKASIDEEMTNKAKFLNIINSVIFDLIIDNDLLSCKKANKNTLKTVLIAAPNPPNH